MDENSSWAIKTSKQLAEFFRSERKKKKISMSTLATFANVSREAVDDFENQRKDIRLSTLLRLLKFCNLELIIQIRK